MYICIYTYPTISDYISPMELIAGPRWSHLDWGPAGDFSALGGFHRHGGYPHSWMVYFMEHHHFDR